MNDLVLVFHVVVCKNLFFCGENERIYFFRIIFVIFEVKLLANICKLRIIFSNNPFKLFQFLIVLIFNLRTQLINLKLIDFLLIHNLILAAQDCEVPLALRQCHPQNLIGLPVLRILLHQFNVNLALVLQICQIVHVNFVYFRHEKHV